VGPSLPLAAPPLISLLLLLFLILRLLVPSSARPFLVPPPPPFCVSAYVQHAETALAAQSIYCELYAAHRARARRSTLRLTTPVCI
jgi:hypothetical protein